VIAKDKGREGTPKRVWKFTPHFKGLRKFVSMLSHDWADLVYRRCLTCLVQKMHVLGMPRLLPPLNALRAFEAAGRHQSFSKAAEEMGVSHSAVSRHVRGLEHRLSAQLFRDLSRGVELTEAGHRYLAQVSPALDQIAEATEAFADRPRGRVVVDVEPLFGNKVLVPRLNSFYSDNPRIDLRIEAGDRLVDVARYEADIAIRFFKEDRPDNEHSLLSATKIYPYASPSLVAGPVSQPEDLLQYTLLQDRIGPMWLEWMTAAGGDVTQVPEIPWRMRAALALESTLAGQAVMLVSADIVAGLVKSGDLIRLHDVGIQKGAYRMVIGQEATRRAAVRQFRDWLLETTGEFRGGEVPSKKGQPNG